MSKILLATVLAVVVLAVGVYADKALNCGPSPGLTKSQCKKLEKACIKRYSLPFKPFKWTGPGCIHDGVRASDGGCQCSTYCGYTCKKACNHDPTCSWNEGTCYYKHTTQPGYPIENCICFHASTSFLRLKTGKSRSLDQIRIGDEVMVFDQTSQKTFYSPVISFLTANLNLDDTGKQVYLEGLQKPLLLTPNHLVYASIDGVAPFDFHRSDALVAGESVMQTVEKQAVVKRIVTISAKGWISPLTESGTIVVNDMYASCHTRHHLIARIMYKPLAWYLSWFPNEAGTLPRDDKSDAWYVLSVRKSILGELFQSIVSSII